MNKDIQSITVLIEQSNNISEEEKKSMLQLLKNANKELEITSFKLERSEKVKYTKGILLEETIEELEHKRKAIEAQNKELEIEASLERVRAKTMAMQKSEELSETVYILFEQFKKLGQNPDQATIGIINEDEWVIEYWVTMYGNQTNQMFRFPIDEPNVTNKIFHAWKNQQKSLVIELSGKELYDFSTFRQSIGGAAYNENEKKRIINVAFFSKGIINVQSNELQSAESIQLLERFAGVFEQTYTRFLDLQKAEAQSREAQIEASLERLRSRSLAMYHTSELQEVIHTVHKELLNLNIAIHGGSFIAINSDIETTLRCWGSGGTADTSEEIHLPVYEKPFCTNLIHRIKNGPGFFTEEYTQKEKKEFFTFLFKHEPWSKLDADQKKETLSSSGGYTRSCCISPNTSIFIINHFGEKFSEADNDILKRFGKAFEQTYTRFLDLQKAEAQARESQIQLALERVRARTMAMQKSEELKEAANLLFRQVQSLGISVWSCGFNIWQKDEKKCTGWMSTNDELQSPFHFPLTDNPTFIRFYESRQKKEDFYAEEVKGDALEAHYRYMISLPEFEKIISQHTARGFSFPHSQVNNVANFAHGNLIFITSKRVPEASDIFKRFAKVFEQTYTRFLDLQKAEAQAREAQIQLALERVRARTMAMQNSNELPEAANLLFLKVQSLGMPAWSAGFCIWDDDKKAITLSMSGEGVLQSSLRMPLTDDPSLMHFREAYERGETFFVEEVGGKALKEHYTYLRTLPGVKETTDDIEKAGFTLPTFQIFHCAYFSKGFLLFITYEPVTEAHDIFKRFAKVFEQTYTRFLDLQKAEAQAREANIETALEKIRSRSLAMHQSDELKEVIAVMFEKMTDLNVLLGTIALQIFDEKTKSCDFWLGNDRQNPALVKLPFDEQIMKEDNYMQECWKAKTNGVDIINKVETVEKINTYFDYVFALNDERVIPQSARDFIRQAKQHAYCLIIEKHSSLFVDSWNGQLFNEEGIIVLKRVAKVFDQAYIRFLDLQKAEAQAREAQIEASLERVRSKTMAMHNSQDVGETVVTLFDELVKLGLDELERCGIGIMHEPYIMEAWTASKTNESKADLVIGHIDMKIHPLFEGSFEGWKQKKEVFQYLLEGDDKINYLNVVNAQPNYNAKWDRASLSNRFILTAFYFNEGCLYAFSVKELSAETAKIITRFAAVFGQTYRRYLDLQKAEAQAREAQIETALEKVRSRSLAMQKGNEMGEVLATVKQKLIELNINFDTVNIVIFAEDNKELKIWSLTKNGLKYDDFNFPYANFTAANDLILARANHLNIFSKCYTGAEKEEFLHYMFELTDFRKITPDRKEYIKSCQNYTISISMGDRIGIQLASFTRTAFTAEENAILIKFTKVFEQAYIRFLDIQNAEVQALEALKRASVDRVRAEIASMRTSADLERITPIIWNELTTLGVPFIRCGVFIMDEENQQIQTMLSTAEGKAIASFQLPYENSEPLTELLPHWRKMKIYLESWDEKTFVESTKTLLQRGAISSPETYATEHPPTNLHLHFLPFLQGMLYVGNEAALNKDELQLVQNLADAFSIAYARYEDFNKLESAKEQIEKTLKDLKATQSLLIQSEKMASLGELTAGIAHEIQNPLNFVNNFSEVSTELVDEMNEEILKGNLEDAQQIAADLKENLSKINHHGKRAGDIVRGMLQHSRSNSGQKEPTDINALADEYLRLAYHGLRAKDKSFNATMHTDFDQFIGMVNIIPQDIGRVILNLITNAFYVVDEKKKSGIENYHPTVSVSTKKLDGKILISVIDNGNGIPPKVLDKIFQPFFTTKPTGQGTGLGLSLSYDIVKAHGGELKVETKEQKGTTFLIILPI